MSANDLVAHRHIREGQWVNSRVVRTVFKDYIVLGSMDFSLKVIFT